MWSLDLKCMFNLSLIEIRSQWSVVKTIMLISDTNLHTKRLLSTTHSTCINKTTDHMFLHGEKWYLVYKDKIIKIISC